MSDTKENVSPSTALLLFVGRVSILQARLVEIADIGLSLDDLLRNDSSLARNEEVNSTVAELIHNMNAAEIEANNIAMMISSFNVTMRALLTTSTACEVV